MGGFLAFPVASMAVAASTHGGLGRGGGARHSLLPHQRLLQACMEGWDGVAETGQLKP